MLHTIFVSPVPKMRCFLLLLQIGETEEGESRPTCQSVCTTLVITTPWFISWVAKVAATGCSQAFHQKPWSNGIPKNQAAFVVVGISDTWNCSVQFLKALYKQWCLSCIPLLCSASEHHPKLNRKMQWIENIDLKLKNIHPSPCAP